MCKITDKFTQILSGNTIVFFENSKVALQFFTKDLPTRGVSETQSEVTISEKDQQVKLKVKEGVLDYLNPRLEQAKNIDESLCIVKNELEKVEEVSEEILRNNGFSQEVKAYITKEEFPMKEYGDMTFPSGIYQAIRVDIGEAQGKNWWCMMYPPLCFVDVTYGIVPKEEKEKFHNMLPEEEYEEMVAASKSNEVEYDFYLVDKLKEWFGK